MGLTPLVVLGLLPHVISASILNARATVNCEFSVAANNGDTCASFEADWGMSDATFQALNPGVSCPGALVADQNYCVIGSVSSATSTLPASTSSSSSSSSNSSAPSSSSATPSSSATSTSVSSAPPASTSQPASTTAPSSVTTTATSPSYSPTQSGLVSNCNNFYQVSSGDTCAAIESKFGISAQEFDSWNPSINSDCTNLFLGYYVCVGVPGAVTTTFVTSTTSSSPYSPTQSGLVSNCDNFYKVSSGDTCAAIESKYGISAEQFDSWNPSINSDCSNLFLGYYVCVGVPGATTAPTTTATSTSTATSTGPSPQMPSTVSNCSKYYMVQSGDTCAAIEAANGISQSQFSSWNPYIDSNCDNLWLGYYVCVGA